MFSGTWVEDAFRGLISGIFLEPLKKMGASPDHLTWAGAGLSLVSACVIPFSPFLGGLIFIVGASLDSLDGTLARTNGQASGQGAFLDSVLDRFSEFFVLVGCWLRLARLGMGGWAVLTIFLALQGSLMVSYARARAEGLGCSLKGGLFERPERATLICAALIFSPLESLISLEPGRLLLWAMVALAAGANLTAAWRIKKALSKLSV